MDYETNDLRLWILNESWSFNKVNKALNSFNSFIKAVKSIINTLNKCYDFLSFKFNEINFKALYNYFKEY